MTPPPRKSPTPYLSTYTRGAVVVTRLHASKLQARWWLDQQGTAKDASLVPVVTAWRRA